MQKRFGQHHAVRGLHLEVEAGECLVLLGPSGCGKTTLLRLLAGLERPDAGTISIGNRVINELPPARRDVAMVFQNYALYPHLTVRRNIAFPLEVRRMPAVEIDARVRDVGARLGLDALLDRRPSELSGGQQQRVALARAIVRNPAVYLMDEPLSNLDAQLRTRTRGELKRLQRELATTTLYVTHDQSEAMTLGRRVALMKDGEIQQLGTPLELYRRPANTFVARFLGNPPMNLLDATLESSSITAGGMTWGHVPLTSTSAPALTMGVRPEDIELSTEARPGWLQARVEVLEPLGNETLVTIKLPEGRLVARGSGTLAVDADAPLWFRVPPEAVLWFDRA
ncbi:MAG: ABC transporter ATP-binding protein, partial [Acidobacteria bacterium]|nr:ABC transporter ATP-binding protein [Acidobacteriota bacterium]